MWSFTLKIRSENGPRLFWEWCHYALYLTFQLFENPLTEIQQKKCNFSFLPSPSRSYYNIIVILFFLFSSFLLYLYIFITSRLPRYKCESIIIICTRNWIWVFVFILYLLKTNTSTQLYIHVKCRWSSMQANKKTWNVDFDELYSCRTFFCFRASCSRSFKTMFSSSSKEKKIGSIKNLFF